MSLQVFELFSTVEKKKYNDYCKNYHSPGASKLNLSPDKLAGVKVLTALTDDFLDPYTYIHICRVRSGCVYTASYNVCMYAYTMSCSYTVGPVLNAWFNDILYIGH